MQRALIAVMAAVAGCATPGAGTYDMSAAQHEAAAMNAEHARTQGPSADHRRAASQLRENEARACAGLTPDQRSTSPLSRLSVVEVKQEFRTEGDGPSRVAVGASMAVRGEPGFSAGELQRLLTCHIAYEQLTDDKLMSDCPLAVPGVYATVRPSGVGFEIQVGPREWDTGPAEEVWRRVSRLGPSR